MYISSADLMTRNTDKRVEIATPVLDKRIEEKIFHMLTVMLSDNIKARVFLPTAGTERRNRWASASIPKTNFCSKIDF